MQSGLYEYILFLFCLPLSVQAWYLSTILPLEQKKVWASSVVVKLFLDLIVEVCDWWFTTWMLIPMLVIWLWLCLPCFPFCVCLYSLILDNLFARYDIASLIFRADILSDYDDTFVFFYDSICDTFSLTKLYVHFLFFISPPTPFWGRRRRKMSI